MTFMVESCEGLCKEKIPKIRDYYGSGLVGPGAKTINVFRACLGGQLTICAQKLRNFVSFSTVRLTFVLSRVCVFLYSLGPRSHSNFVVVGKSSQNIPKPMLIFWSSILSVYTLLKVVGYYDLSVLSMSVVGFQKKVWIWR